MEIKRSYQSLDECYEAIKKTYCDAPSNPLPSHLNSFGVRKTKPQRYVRFFLSEPGKEIINDTTLWPNESTLPSFPYNCHSYEVIWQHTEFAPIIDLTKRKLTLEEYQFEIEDRDSRYPNRVFFGKLRYLQDLIAEGKLSAVGWGKKNMCTLQFIEAYYANGQPVGDYVLFQEGLAVTEPPGKQRREGLESMLP